ncbi:MAG: thioesterase domain-containing protein [Cyanobacteria bacterium J06642_2]
MSQSEFVELVCAIADHHVREIVELYPEGPYQLIGHSFGSVIAFSIAQKLQSEKGRVSFFGSIDTHGPHAPLYRALKPFETFYLDRLYNLRHFKSLSGTQRWEYFNSRMRQYLSSLLKPKKSISETAGIAHQYNDNETIENTASPNLSSPRSSSHLADIDVIEKLLTLNFETKIENLHVFLARQERTKYPWKHVLSPRAGWSTDSASEIRVHHCSGDHWQIVLEPHVRELAQKLVKAIAESS